ncbi:MAG TPA: hypothetical protein VF623_12945 [Segetibacter sp.]
MNEEQKRIDENYSGKKNWLKWGPYLSERQWGTVREDYSANGDAWNYISHDMARSKAYRWGEESIAGFCDDQQNLCIGLALWNGKDPILKERLFGLTNGEGNHGEDVKELYYYVDATPSHSYQKMLYKYPQAAFPYEQLIEENRKRTKTEAEFELIDTGLFDNDSYFDVFVEYAKNEVDDILASYTIHNRSKQDAALHVLPQLWYRNTWVWNGDSIAPLITYEGNNAMLLHAENQPDFYCYVDGSPTFLFTENETNNQKLYKAANRTDFTKDGINDYVVNGNSNAVNKHNEGTKVAAWYQLNIAAAASVQVKLRLVNKKINCPFQEFDNIMSARVAEANKFYEDKQLHLANEDEKLVQRQAWAGMLWSKQFYSYNINQWLTGDANQPAPPTGHANSRNRRWKHFIADNIISMPDKWEYPWFAAWDLAFHCIAFTSIDPDFAKGQLRLLVKENFMHPSGQLPAYEWDFNECKSSCSCTCRLAGF